MPKGSGDDTRDVRQVRSPLADEASANTPVRGPAVS